jgi:hypothetical protein
MLTPRKAASARWLIPLSRKASPRLEIKQRERDHEADDCTDQPVGHPFSPAIFRIAAAVL